MDNASDLKIGEIVALLKWDGDRYKIAELFAPTEPSAADKLYLDSIDPEMRQYMRRGWLLNAAMHGWLTCGKGLVSITLTPDAHGPVEFSKVTQIPGETAVEYMVQKTADLEAAAKMFPGKCEAFWRAVPAKAHV